MQVLRNKESFTSIFRSTCVKDKNCIKQLPKEQGKGEVGNSENILVNLGNPRINHRKDYQEGSSFSIRIENRHSLEFQLTLHTKTCQLRETKFLIKDLWRMHVSRANFMPAVPHSWEKNFSSSFAKNSFLLSIIFGSVSNRISHFRASFNQ